MNRDDIIRMAREAGLGFKKGSGWGTHAGTQRFAELVAAAEREECHKLRQTLPNPFGHCQVSAHAHDMAIADYGRAIRARSKT